MAKVSRNEKRLVDTVTGRTLSRHKSGMVAQKKAKQLANKTGHAIKLVDDYGVQFVFQPGGGWEHGKSGRSNPKRSRTTGTTVPAHVRINPRTGRIQVFVTPKVAEKLRGGKGLRVAGNPGSEVFNQGFTYGKRGNWTALGGWADLALKTGDTTAKSRKEFMSGYRAGKKVDLQKRRRR